MSNFGATGPTGSSTSIQPKGLNGPNGPIGPVCPVGVTGATGSVGVNEYLILKAYLKITDISELAFDVSYTGIMDIQSVNRLMNQNTAYMTFKNDMSIDEMQKVINQRNMPGPIANKVLEIMLRIIKQTGINTYSSSYLNTVELSTKINSFNEELALMSFRNVMRAYGVNQNLSFEQAEAAVREFFVVQPVHSY